MEAVKRLPMYYITRQIKISKELQANIEVPNQTASMCSLITLFSGCVGRKTPFYPSPIRDKVDSGARYTYHLKPKIFVSSMQFVWNFRES